MGNNYRIRTDFGSDKNIRININQNFDFLEILSLKLKQDDVYTRFCADYGVVAGRVIVNGGYGVPNANVSIFIPLSEQDENDVVISTLYPYKRVDQKNEDGYRYNLLPYRPEYGGHTPTGTFPDREDLLTRQEVLEVYEKYYKFTAKTNESGDFMIVGVPLGIQTIVMDLDLSNIGCFSLRPADLIRAGLAGPGQFNGNQFKSSTDLDSLPQIVNFKKDIDVSSFWGEEELCNIGITRVDFDLRELGIEIKPQAVFMGSILSTSNEDFLKTTCKPKKDVGNLCDLVTGEGKILAIRQTIGYDSTGRPVLEQFNLENGGDVIDENGTWLVEVPMNLDYVITNEFGEQVISNDPSIGIPTKGKYRFRIQYQNEAGMENDIMRGDYLVPNIKEWGWTSSNINGPDTFTAAQLDAQKKSYAFSLDWNDYGDLTTTLGQQMVQDAINCEDKFYEFTFNKVYTIANFVDRWKWGFNRSRHLGIKEITDRRCTTTNNRFPVNDGVRNFDFIFFLFNLFVTILTPVFVALIPILHLLALLWPILKWFLAILFPAFLVYQSVLFGVDAVSAWPAVGLAIWSGIKSLLFLAAATAFAIKVAPLLVAFKFKGINLPMMSYPDCEACPCDSGDLDTPEITGTAFGSTGSGGSQTANYGSYVVNNRGNSSFLADTNSGYMWGELAGDPTNTAPVGMNPDGYGGGAQTEQNKYNADINGFRYAIAGYPTAPEIGTPVVSIFSDSQYVQAAGIPLSQSLNLANIRERYFDTTAQNIVQTTVNNPGYPSQPFTDNILVVLCDPGTYNTYKNGDLISFINPENNTIISDINNVSGVTNQFGTNAITGTAVTSTTVFNKTITYLQPNGSVSSPITLRLTATTEEKEYKYKGGIEYFQVITGMTTNQANGLLSGNQSLLRKYFFGKTQKIYYERSNGNNDDVTLNQLTSMGDSWKNLEVLFLVRGVDPFTEKQKIKYDLSKLFGYSLGSDTVFVEGNYFLNIPIQPNSGSGSWYTGNRTPEAHTNNINTPLYHEPFNFNLDITSFSPITTKVINYYSSLDRSVDTFKPYSNNDYQLETLTTTSGPVSDSSNIIQTITFDHTNARQGVVEGGSFIGGSNQTGNIFGTLSNYNARVYAPKYNGIILTINSTNPKIIVRSDRLPTSDKLQNLGNNSFTLHQNDNFAVYRLDSTDPFSNPSEGNTASDSTNNSGDFSGDTQSAQDSVLSTFSCEGMVPLKCYGYDSNNEFIVLTPCSDNDPKVVEGGCYKFIQKPYLVGIGKDIKNFAEWKSRFRMMFGACRGVFSHVFQNNWVNGTLYMFSFKKKTIFNVVGQPKKYKFCGTLDNSFRPGQGPIYYTEGTTNSLFYRSSPYDGTNFIGQEPRKKDLSGNWQSAGFKGMNDKNLFFPTTIMDMGSRDEFVREICFNPALEAYFVDEVKSTSFNETADILQLFFVSRLVSSNFLQNLIGAGDASINKLFSRSEDRMDGDVVQMFSINSEFGIEPFSEDEYDQANDLYVAGGTGADPLMGIFFQSNRELRALASPGSLVFSPTLVSNFGYPNSQEVPMYKWKAATTTTIFGNELNDWVTTANQNNTGNGFFSENYQDLSFVQSPYSPYFNNGPTGGQGYIYQQNGQESPWPASQSDKFIVGAPYHFYFGLNVGKSAINRYITKYILNTNG